MCSAIEICLLLFTSWYPSGWSQGAGCLDSYLRMISSHSATAVNGSQLARWTVPSLYLLAATWHLSHRRFAPSRTRPSPKAAVALRLRGGGKCRVPPLRVKLVYIVYRLLYCCRVERRSFARRYLRLAAVPRRWCLGQLHRPTGSDCRSRTARVIVDLTTNCFAIYTYIFTLFLRNADQLH